MKLTIWTNLSPLFLSVLALGTTYAFANPADLGTCTGRSSGHSISIAVAASGYDNGYHNALVTVDGQTVALNDSAGVTLPATGWWNDGGKTLLRLFDIENDFSPLNLQVDWAKKTGTFYLNKGNLQIQGAKLICTAVD